MNVSESVGEGDCEGVGKAKGEGMGVGYGCLVWVAAHTPVIIKN